MLEFVVRYWIEFIFACFIGILGYIFKQYMGVKNGMCALLRNEIVRIYENYINLGYCPSYMKENLDAMYINYHKLGGNGMATAMVNELYKLPCEFKKEDLNYERENIEQIT